MQAKMDKVLMVLAVVNLLAAIWGCALLGFSKDWFDLVKSILQMSLNFGMFYLLTE